MKKINFKKLFTIILALALFIGLVTVIKNLSDDMEVKSSIEKHVEPYCAAAHIYDVTEYKKCKDLTPAELIDKLTKDVKAEYDDVKLPSVRI